MRYRIGPRFLRYHGGRRGRGISFGLGWLSFYKRLGRRSR